MSLTLYLWIRFNQLRLPREEQSAPKRMITGSRFSYHRHLSLEHVTSSATACVKPVVSTLQHRSIHEVESCHRRMLPAETSRPGKFKSHLPYADQAALHTTLSVMPTVLAIIVLYQSCLWMHTSVLVQLHLFFKVQLHSITN